MTRAEQAANRGQMILFGDRDQSIRRNKGLSSYKHGFGRQAVGHGLFHRVSKLPTTSAFLLTKGMLSCWRHVVGLAHRIWH